MDDFITRSVPVLRAARGLRLDHQRRNFLAHLRILLAGIGCRVLPDYSILPIQQQNVGSVSRGYRQALFPTPFTVIPDYRPCLDRRGHAALDAADRHSAKKLRDGFENDDGLRRDIRCVILGEMLVPASRIPGSAPAERKNKNSRAMGSIRRQLDTLPQDGGPGKAGKGLSRVQSHFGGGLRARGIARSKPGPTQNSKKKQQEDAGASMAGRPGVDPAAESGILRTKARTGKEVWHCLRL